MICALRIDPILECSGLDAEGGNAVELKADIISHMRTTDSINLYRSLLIHS